MTPDCFDSTALPEGAPHLIDRLDAASEVSDRWVAGYGPWYLSKGHISELLAVAREARDLLDAEGFGR